MDLVPSALDSWFFCFVRVPLMDRSSQKGMLSHWTLDYPGVTSIRHHRGQKLCISHQLGKLPHQTEELPTGSFPTIKMGSIAEYKLHASSIRPEVPGIPKCLSPSYTQPQGFLLWPLLSCVLCRTNSGPGQKLPQAPGTSGVN